jgi:lysophospholipase L1-like esterase
MKKLLVLLLCPLIGFCQIPTTSGYHRVAQVFARAPQSVTSQVVPYASVTVTVNSTGAPATIYSDPQLSSLISPPTITADDSGNYDYYVPLSYLVAETISSPGQGVQTIYNIGQYAGTGGGVSQIVAGANVTLSPSGGTGVVTINAANSTFNPAVPGNIGFGTPAALNATAVTAQTYGYGSKPTTALVAEGDSLTAGYLLSSPSTQSWPAKLATQPFFNGAVLHNAAVTGSTCASMTSRYATAVQPYKPNGTTITKAYLIFMIGRNDEGNPLSSTQTCIASYIAQAVTDGFTVIPMTVMPSSLLSIGPVGTQTATITSFSATTTSATFIAANTFTVGQYVYLYPFSYGVPYTGYIGQVTAASSTQFTLATSGSAISSTSVTGVGTNVAYASWDSIQPSWDTTREQLNAWILQNYPQAIDTSQWINNPNDPTTVFDGTHFQPYVYARMAENIAAKLNPSGGIDSIQPIGSQYNPVVQGELDAGSIGVTAPVNGLVGSYNSNTYLRSYWNNGNSSFFTDAYNPNSSTYQPLIYRVSAATFALNGGAQVGWNGTTFQSASNVVSFEDGSGPFVQCTAAGYGGTTYASGVVTFQPFAGYSGGSISCTDLNGNVIVQTYPSTSGTFSVTMATQFQNTGGSWKSFGAGNFNIQNSAFQLNGNTILPSALVGYTGTGTKIPTASTMTASLPVCTDANSTETTSGCTALPNGTTATTQTEGDNSTKLGTTAYTDGHDISKNCGTTTACANTLSTVIKSFYGTVALLGGTATVTGFSPAFTSTSTYVCTVSDTATTPAAATWQATSSSSITIKGTGTDTISYICLGT